MRIAIVPHFEQSRVLVNHGGQLAPGTSLSSLPYLRLT
jgi:hypothetical protein